MLLKVYYKKQLKNWRNIGNKVDCMKIFSVNIFLNQIGRLSARKVHIPKER